jgi:DNA polymerase III delta subunit
VTAASLAFFWGDDDLAAGRAVSRMVEAISADAGGPVERFDVRGDRNQAAQLIGQLNEKVATQSMFGGGTLGLVTNVGALMVKNEDRDALLAILPLVAPGSGIAFVEATRSGAKEPGQKRVVDAVRALGGEVRNFPAPKAGQLTGWIEREARERQMHLAPGAARELAVRVGGFVVDNDADRRTQTRMTIQELEKLALYRQAEPISPDDVKALVPEAIPGSVWAFTDAVGLRDVGRASALMDLLAGTTPEPVLLAVLHRRIRELIEIADHVAAGASEGSMSKTLGLHPVRAQILTTQARRWSLDELRAALEGLLDLDATVKGAPGSPGSDAQRSLGFTLWIADHVNLGAMASRSSASRLGERESDLG